jgi:hypothetical protein
MTWSEKLQDLTEQAEMCPTNTGHLFEKLDEVVECLNA